MIKSVVFTYNIICCEKGDFAHIPRVGDIIDMSRMGEHENTRVHGEVVAVFWHSFCAVEIQVDMTLLERRTKAVGF